MQRITVKDAAQILRTTPLTVRTAMEQGSLPIGIVIRHKARSTFIIYQEKLESWMERQ